MLCRLNVLYMLFNIHYHPLSFPYISLLCQCEKVFGLLCVCLLLEFRKFLHLVFVCILVEIALISHFYTCFIRKNTLDSLLRPPFCPKKMHFPLLKRQKSLKIASAKIPFSGILNLQNMPLKYKFLHFSS